MIMEILLEEITKGTNDSRNSVSISVVRHSLTRGDTDFWREEREV